MANSLTTIPNFTKTQPSTINLNFSLLGGKGGFGSLLRGVASKAGQKKTNNFDAYRDMSGRRLRHVNAEKSWSSGRRRRSRGRWRRRRWRRLRGGDGAEKYVQKYREDSARCVEEVERSVRESIGAVLVGRKRKLMEKLKLKAGKEQSDAKKLKIWMRKRTVGEIDNDE